GGGRGGAGGQGGEGARDDLGVDAVAEYRERRFAGSRSPSEVARLVRERSDGNPLFLVTLVEHLLARGAIVERDRHWHVAQELRGELAADAHGLPRPVAERPALLREGGRAALSAARRAGGGGSACGARRRARAGIGRTPGSAASSWWPAVPSCGTRDAPPGPTARWPGVSPSGIRSTARRSPPRCPVGAEPTRICGSAFASSGGTERGP